ncbi:hypothetical protein G9272_13670 [Streptomyces asoensis]|uniref:Uncharacterized protein n=1 Tax=Streptomyces asoensis TaxID=249586 RepID=A0A6M4WNE9_9ACTN|nr:hypothetical protein [Streptomyces asoensis]QJT01241.1 hypothetical protein G9272_13670 [Streptomyces asoensis]
MARKTTITVTGDHTGDVGGTVISGATGPVALNGDIRRHRPEQADHRPPDLLRQGQDGSRG